ncbi:ABC-2 transporter permease [Alkalibacillus haloalkaliphilus]|uniref:ABC-2 transporter permease n=1 Tax=Alkalibacillus haloalkaliphilus TaxID=94136 RepID=UPI0029353FDD|nr:ABC-2 transporter permease [Alkalibacillus haloalkaliphilus]MDV2581899.1 ABC-2 transporter permease [Alkalibacillus haloalkaliphilus]
MFNLIKRDLILQKKMMLIFIPFILFFIIMGTSTTLIALVASVFIPFNAFYYDEKAETNILLNSLPYTRKEIVASRYIGAVVYMFLAIGLTSLILLVFNQSFTLNEIAIGATMFMLFAALTFPIFYIFKPGYLMIVVLISFFVFLFIIENAIPYVMENFTVLTEFVLSLTTGELYILGTLTILVIYGVSWLASTIIYQQKAL